MLRTPLLCLTLVLGPSLMAQPFPRPKVFDRTTWLDAQTLVFMPFAGEAAFLHRLDGQKTQRIQAPPGEASGHTWSARDRSLYLIHDIGSEEKEILSLQCWALDSPKPEWTLVGTLAEGSPRFMIPLDGGLRFLAIDPYDGFVQGQKASFVALYRLARERQVLELESLVDMPFESKAHIGMVDESVEEDEPTPTAPRPRCAPVDRALHPSLVSPAVSDTHVVLAATRAGVAWVFDLKRGQCVTYLNLSGLKLSELPELSWLDHFLLGIQPTQEGDFIVATRHPEVLALGRRLKKANPTPDQLKKGLETLLAGEGRIRWQTLDRKTLSLKDHTRTAFPELRTLSYSQVGRLRFLVDFKGEVVTNYSKTWNQLVEAYASKKEVSTVKQDSTKAPAVPKNP